MVLGKLDIYMQKNENGSLSYTIHKVNSKWIRLKYKTRNCKTPRDKHLDIGLGNDFLGLIPKTQTTKTKTDK